jgi:hypothetical protein
MMVKELARQHPRSRDEPCEFLGAMENGKKGNKKKGISLGIIYGIIMV